MKVSIIIPVFNLEKYIDATIQSCLNQTYKDIEVVIVNDGSKDKSVNIINRYLGDSRVKFIQQENAGVSAARNNGIVHATGEYITFLDGDDLLNTNTIEKNVEIIERQQVVVDWVAFPVIRADENGNEQDSIGRNLLRSFRYPEVKMVSAKEAFHMYENDEFPPVVWAMLYRREFFDRKFVDGRFEDTYMFLELLGKRPDILISPYGGYRYINRENSFINEEWTPEKWIYYTRARLQYVRIGRLLSPEKEMDYQAELTSIFYNLRYLKFKKRNQVGFDKPLAYFLEECPIFERSYKLALLMMLKCMASFILRK